MAAPKLDIVPRGLYIGGRWVAPAEGGSFASINPSTMETLADIPAATDRDVDAAVQAAKTAFADWSRMPIKERAGCLVRLAARIEQAADPLSLIDAVDSGNAITGMRGDMIWTAEWLRYCAGLVTEIKGETFSQGPRHLNLTRRQPYGVVAKINPFNHPFRFCAEKAASSRDRSRRRCRASSSASCAQGYFPTAWSISSPAAARSARRWCVIPMCAASALSARCRPAARSQLKPRPRSSA
jgi:hypothetical protein